MCGIAGYVGGTVEPELLQRQLTTLAHRGPDSIGLHVTRRAAIGQTRLAVIDLVTGDPPITADDGRIGVAFNGEIYNYRELRCRLVGEGHTFRTAGDTEVIAHLAERLGPVELARSLRGMFAFAVWDERAGRLVLARDHFGKKPLYYWHGPGRLVFGSEIKALLAHPAVPSQLDPDAIPAFLAVGYVPGPKTFYAGIQTLPPGHVLVLDAGATPRLQQYWTPPLPGVAGVERLDVPDDVAAAGVRKLLSAAVRRRMVADVPLGAFLSGGIDSSAIVALMAQESTRPVRTFTIGFERSGFDERQHARLVSQHLGTDHTEFVVDPKAVDLIDELVWHYDEPFGDSTAIPTYLLSQQTRACVTVALSGDGGDELFAGYERFLAGQLVDRYQRVPLPLRRVAAARLRTSTAAAASSPRVGRLRRFASAGDIGLPAAYHAWAAVAPDDVITSLVGQATRMDTSDLSRRWAATEGGETVDRLLAINLSTYLVGDLLPKTDRMSMAHGLEVRSPFLDVDLAEYALRLPVRQKIRRFRLKAVLKDAVRDLLPDQIVDRPKRGFGVPVSTWFRTDLATYAQQTLTGPSARLRSHVRSGAVDTILKEHRSGRQDHGDLLWSLLTLEVFLRRRDW